MSGDSVRRQTILLILGLALAAATFADSPSSAQTIVADYTDATGTISIRIYVGPWSYGQHVTAFATVEDDYALVGGGAEINGDGAPGALLTASYPNPGLTTWYAASKDHIKPYYHALRAYAIGLRLAGVSAVNLKHYMYVGSTRSGVSNHVTSITRLPQSFMDYQLVGGGARVNWSGAGLLLTESYPFAEQWVASAKDHLTGARGSVDSYVIGITRREIPGFGYLVAEVASAEQWTSTGYARVFVQDPPGALLTSIGGRCTYSGAGRMLSDMLPLGLPPYPTTTGAYLTSKDHEQRSSGSVIGFAVYVSKL